MLLGRTWRIEIPTTALAAICAHSVSVSIGMVQGFSAILIPQLLDQSEIPVDMQIASWLASLGAITNPLGSLSSGFLAELFGRRNSMIISSVPFIIGWLSIAFGSDIRWLYFGRLVTGFAAGMSTACYTYVTEVSASSNRGLLQAFGPVCCSLGIFLVYLLGFFVQWRAVAMAGAVVGSVTIVLIHLSPESPVWLVGRGRLEEALGAWRHFRQDEAVARAELEDHLAAGRGQKVGQVEGEGSRGGYFSGETLRPFFALVVLFLAQSLSGIYTILYYAVGFIREAATGADEHLASICVGALRVAVSICAVPLVHRYRRKALCATSGLGMGVAALVAALYVRRRDLLPPTSPPMPVPLLPLVCILAHVIFSMVGLLPIPWIIVGELFPARTRGIMSGVVICIAQASIFACLKAYPDVVQAVGLSGVFFAMAAAALGAVLFVEFCLPETKGRSLGEIQRGLRGEEGGVSNPGFEGDKA